jgi:hypothetical protein
LPFHSANVYLSKSKEQQKERKKKPWLQSVETMGSAKTMEDANSRDILAPPDDAVGDNGFVPESPPVPAPPPPTWLVTTGLARLIVDENAEDTRRLG